MISVAICTRDRARLLDRTLDSLAQLSVPQGLEWELLLVDNASTDDTPVVIRSHVDGLPIRKLYEPTPGLSNARNQAVKAARGDHILWTDDDVRVDPLWLGAYLRAFREYSGAAFFGGPIRPDFEGSPPTWLSEAIRIVPGAFGVHELDQRPFVFTSEHRQLPFGANYAVRTDIQRRYPYDPGLGRRPGAFVRGEETALFRTLLEAGHGGRWVPEAGIRHLITKELQTTSHIRGYYRREAQLSARTNGGAAAPPVRSLWRAATAELRYAVLRAGGSSERWIRALVEAGYAWGHLQTVLRGRRLGRDDTTLVDC